MTVLMSRPRVTSLTSQTSRRYALDVDSVRKAHRSTSKIPRRATVIPNTSLPVGVIQKQIEIISSHDLYPLQTCDSFAYHAFLHYNLKRVTLKRRYVTNSLSHSVSLNPSAFHPSLSITEAL